ncbi:M20/M25/M40 family metallo-hydrolase [Pontibacter cellulosilyticus]|uniref:Carboxypeptidase Q n=1 Tax=Pontibacter cellulosilyticus TaxID=1720253 RepID=A0A923N831_9BACT|nr:M20/M25/M40 family metallo-hydrolase [Pontibacter cellulosilyticus]MBC5993507.1 M20/M25/M40 family metallo-hydrolase [Pontibacter cellulosilyticus]
MFKKPLLLAAVALQFAFVAQAQQEPVNLDVVHRIKQEGLKNSQVMETAFYLTDVSGPRLSGSPGLDRANQWAKNKLTEWGLKNAHLEEWGEFGKGWEIEKSYIAMTAPYYQHLIATPKAWTPGTNGPVKAKAVLVEIEKEEDLQKYKGQLAGKIILTKLDSEAKTSFEADAKRHSHDDLEKLAMSPEATGNTNSSWTPERIAQYRARMALRNKAAEFFKAEGAAVILSSRGGIHGTHFTSNGAPYAKDAAPALPELEMGLEDYGRLVRLLEAKQPVELEVETKTKFHTDNLKGYNIIAEIPGTHKKLKDEVVMLGGHIDSWHAATGATDNAAGVAVMMEAVRILQAMGIQPKRTIRIALWGGEEQGLHGSRGYVKQHFGDPATMKLTKEHEKLSAYYNLDNGTGKIRGVYLQGNDAVRPLMEAWLAPFHDLGATTVTIRNTGGTDHLAFDAVGLPGFQFIQDEIEYDTRTHHTNQDTYERLQADDLKQAATIVASIVYHTAMRDKLVPRKPLPKPRQAS